MSRWYMAVFAALSIALFLAGFVWLDTSQAQPPSQPLSTVEHKAKVLTTNLALAKGSFIERESLVWKEVSLAERESLGEVFLQPVFELDQIAGSVAVQFIPADSVLSPEMLLRPEQSDFLSALVKPGMRAISIELDPMAAGLGLLRPGNKVDVLLTSQSEIDQDANGTPIYNNMAVETVLQNIHLLAIGNQYSPHQKPEKSAKSYDPTSVTFEVSLQDAEKLVLASKLGELSLVLRGNNDQTEVANKPLKWAKDISGAYDLEQQPTQSVTVIRGNVKEGQ
ncbi:TPA: Flp pilus assembly protein CpaB [Vibrio vulnificus]|uniref:Flp pilus assembly protein CpaB n=1 Tax=Vibrio vulnificus TaxID=672 RepID=UPI0005F15600|nr:Flp pilus assembly protein CpaB [Vibrio vulnificus]HBC3532783.1 Flp pilus assembly protein CpaB [Vibrio vulnificus]HDY8144909.1 Flp pilus assembly protein CpaB [Vibrio vulnificus]